MHERDFIIYTEYVVGDWAADRGYGADREHPYQEPWPGIGVRERQRRNLFFPRDELAMWKGRRDRGETELRFSKR